MPESHSVAEDLSTNMQLLKSKNVFESCRFLYYLNKFCGYLFFTISKDRFGRYSVETTAKDYFIFIVSTAFSSYAIYKFIDNPVIGNSDAIVVFIGLFLISKMMIVHPVFNVLYNFHNREKIFQILCNFHWIDKQVSLMALLMKIAE